MNAPTLTPNQLRDLVDRYTACPGIVRGIIAEHERRGGSNPRKAPDFDGPGSIADFFRNFFEDRR